jgi:hypothetical protein
MAGLDLYTQLNRDEMYRAPRDDDWPE